ncbi:MAG TPA: glycosyltransferase family 9 protein [Fimbriimonadaceae bacterium]|nr:glycosyltransferase family 9 protein [Fimbriimonadaceae bacterium]
MILDLGKTLILTHPARLGDTVMSLPLTRACSDVTETWSTAGAPFRFLFERAGLEVGAAEALNPKRLGALIDEARRLRSAGFQTVFLVRPSFRSALLCWLARIPNRIGDATEGRGFLLSRLVNLPRERSELDRLEGFGASAGLKVERRFGLVPEGHPRRRSVFGIVPGGSYGQKFIAPDVLQQVIGQLLERGYTIELHGGPGEEVFGQALLREGVEDHIGRYKLPEMVDRLASLGGMLSADGGLYHLSVACGTRTVGAYGPTSFRNWWHDWGGNVVVHAPAGDMRNLTPEMVWEAVERIIKPSTNTGTTIP